VEGDTAHLRVDIAPDPTEQQLFEALQGLVETVLGVIVGANELVGGTEPGHELHALTDEFEAIRDG
jgi:hypothetical protein